MTDKNFSAWYVVDYRSRSPGGTKIGDFIDEVDPWLSYLNCETVNNIQSLGAIIHDCPDGEAVSYQEAIEAAWKAILDFPESDPEIPQWVVDWMARVGLPVWPVEEFDYSIAPGII